MTTDLAIELTNVGMRYRIPKTAASSLKQTFVDVLRNRVGYHDVQALSDVSVQVRKGETLAVIGRNGAGKSTLLKVLARVLPPTDGRVVVRGHVAPMIELGAGFNPELTGNENALLYGTLLGRVPRELEARIPELADWAGLTDHMHLPLRTYSSGMVARLAFAVATDKSPDVLLVDEVLSVGDVEFQEKSSERAKAMVESGAAVVLVTHNMDSVLELATDALWLDHGKVRACGPAKEVVEQYLADIHHGH